MPIWFSNSTCELTLSFRIIRARRSSTARMLKPSSAAINRFVFPATTCPRTSLSACVRTAICCWAWRRCSRIAPVGRVELHRPLDAVAQLLHSEGFFEKIHRSRLHRLNRHADIAKAGDEDGGQVDAPGEEFLLQFQAAHARQADVQDQASRTIGRIGVEKFVGGSEGGGLESQQADEFPQCSDHRRIVVDGIDSRFGDHGLSPR